MPPPLVPAGGADLLHRAPHAAADPQRLVLMRILVAGIERGMLLRPMLAAPASHDGRSRGRRPGHVRPRPRGRERRRRARQSQGRQGPRERERRHGGRTSHLRLSGRHAESYPICAAAESPARMRAARNFNARIALGSVAATPGETRGRSSAGRAPEWHSGGREFDPHRLHQSFFDHLEPAARRLLAFLGWFDSQANARGAIWSAEAMPPLCESSRQSSELRAAAWPQHSRSLREGALHGATMLVSATPR